MANNHQFTDLAALQQTVAIDICQHIRISLQGQDKFLLALSGGNTPLGIFDYLRENLIDTVNWSKVYVYWVDERAVAHSSNLSNYGNAYRHLFKFTPNVNLFPIQSDLEPQQAAANYNQQLLSVQPIQFDYILLGVGTDGHIASLFHDQYQFGDKLAINTLSPDNLSRITMTPKMLNVSNHTAMLVTSQEKSKVINLYKNQQSKGMGINLLEDSNVNYYICQ